MVKLIPIYVGLLKVSVSKKLSTLTEDFLCNQNFKLCLLKILEKQKSCFSDLFPFKSYFFLDKMHSYHVFFFISEIYYFQKHIHIWAGTKHLRQGYKRPLTWHHPLEGCILALLQLCQPFTTMGIRIWQEQVITRDLPFL